LLLSVLYCHLLLLLLLLLFVQIRLHLISICKSLSQLITI
jgi:hypothetical protein